MKSKFFEKNKDKKPDKLLDAIQGETLGFLMGITSELAPLVKLSVQPIEKKLNAKEAMQEIDKLGAMQLFVLLDNYQYGLRGKHLRDLNQQANPITPYHFSALKSLIQEKNQAPEKAIEILINASPEEVKDMAGSLINYSDFEQTLDMNVFRDIIKDGDDEEAKKLGFELYRFR
jgi:hypothetical protein